MANSDHDEADTRIVLHVHDSLERGVEDWTLRLTFELLNLGHVILFIHSLDPLPNIFE